MNIDCDVGHQDNIRWTDKVYVNNNGDIIDFEGRVIGHIDMKGLNDERT